MNCVLNHLIQLQGLTLIRDEERNLHGAEAKIDRLNADIEALVAALPPQTRVVYQRLYGRDHIALAPLNNNQCSLCGMLLSSATIQAVRLERDIQTCPSCARILYDPDGAKWIGERPKRSAGDPKTGIARFSSDKLMIPRLAATTRDAAIRELAVRMQEAKFIDDAEKLTEAAIAREKIASTALGLGMAFPHVRAIEGGGLSLALGLSQDGIAFDDGVKCRFVFFCTIPTAVSAFYLKLVAGLAETIRKEANRTALFAAKDAAALWKALVKATRYTVK
ncbi:MAG: PTS sugar transporter subunit IIA [Kiritimatiellaeota bacterium]|nr:PTS sugar transporter subunit IIA [Kiritimatiellota bacterium]